MKLLSLFSGIGAFEKALKNIGIDFELVGFSEIDKYAIKSYCAIHNVDESLNLGDITKIDMSRLPKDKNIDMITHGSPCLAGGTKVITSDGYKNIENIKKGDKVLTHTNAFKPVTNLGSNGIKDIYKLEASGILPIYCTNNHPFYVRTKIKQWNNKIRKYEYTYSNPEKVRLFNLSKNSNYIGIPIVPDIQNELYDLDDETLWLLGRYVADGYYINTSRKDRPSNSKSTYICVGNKKELEFEKHLSTYKYNKDTNYKNCTKYRFGTTLTNTIINLNLGNGAMNKKIPIHILQLPKNKLKIFLDGYMSGDGCNLKNSNIYQATTISRELAESLVLAIQKVYNVGCAIYYNKRPQKHIIEDRVVNQNDTYMIRYRLNSKKQAYIVDKNCIWYPIKKITNTHTQKAIYNITVEDDHTYTANNIITFNCQDFSIAGKQAGGDLGTGTRSSLMWNTINIVTFCKPKYVIWENVKNLLSKKHRHNFDSYLSIMESLGYNNYYQILNAKDYGIPQNRERVYTVSIRKDIDKGNFKFPEKEELKLRLKDMLEDEVDEKYYLSDEKLKNYTRNFGSKGKMQKEICDTLQAAMGNGGGNIPIVKSVRIGGIFDTDKSKHQAGSIYDKEQLAPTLDAMQGGWRQPCILIKNGTKKGYLEGKDGDSVNLSYPTSNTRRGRVGNQVSQTLQCNDSMGVITNDLAIRKLTPLECWKLMGFTDEDFYKAKDTGISNTQLYKQAGNSIVVNVLEKIFLNLFKED